MSIAEPISNAMGALFQIERSGGTAATTNGPVALEATRRALSLLQQQPSNHPAVQQALEAVAGSLSLIHSLASGKQPAAPAPPRAPAPAAASPPYAHAPKPQPHAPSPQTQPHAAAHRQPQPEPARPPVNAPVQSPQAYAATYVAPPVQATAPQGTPYQPTVLAQHAVAPVAGPAAAPATPGLAQNGPAGRVDAELGAHSASNFYKGLSGNDVVEHGGIFISTYNIPRIGQSITVHVSMPGGYEFDALAIVRWTRDTGDSSQGQSAPPGFGAQFTQITPEARQLVYRYVRNREPLFHDDL
jgi:hypothetical protein